MAALRQSGDAVHLRFDLSRYGIYAIREWFWWDNGADGIMTKRATAIRLGRIRPVHLASLLAVGLALAGPVLLVSAPLAAQDNPQASAEARLRRMESEIRALQRQVFPGADGRVFGPEIAPTPRPSGSAGAAPPSSTPVSDLLTRMDAIESQIAKLTAQTEVNSNRIAQIEARLGPAATETNATPSATPAATPAPVVTPTPRPTSSPTPRPTPAASTAPSAQRLAAVSAIEKPSTRDKGDDEYSYGFRLWEARFYPEAQQQLKLMIDKYPRHEKISYARNLLGRAYLDDGKPREAATWFLQNYQGDKSGARAPDSLLLLAESMRRLNDKSRACIALSEFAQTYAAEAAGRLKSQYDATRTPLKCS